MPGAGPGHEAVVARVRELVVEPGVEPGAEPAAEPVAEPVSEPVEIESASEESEVEEESVNVYSPFFTSSGSTTLIATGPKPPIYVGYHYRYRP